MRERVRSAHPVPSDRFDVKHSPGGMMDAEFVVQALVLAHAHTHRTLLANAGNIALLVRAEHCGLLPAGVGQAAADGYRELRRAQHRARLDEKPTHFALRVHPSSEPDESVAPAAVLAARQAILAAWQHVLGAH